MKYLKKKAVIGGAHTCFFCHKDALIMVIGPSNDCVAFIDENDEHWIVAHEICTEGIDYMEIELKRVEK